MKWASTRVSSPRRTIACVQKDFWTYCTFGANRAPILHRNYPCPQTDQNVIPHDPCHLGVPLGASKWFPSLWYDRRKPSNYLVSRLALSSNGPKRASTCASWPRSTIGCAQNDFWAYSTFGAKCAPILHRHKHCFQMDQNEIPHVSSHLGVPSGASKTISEPMVRWAQTVHLSCDKISTISKQTEVSIHQSLIT
jgi:hypothetical protein